MATYFAIFTWGSSMSEMATLSETAKQSEAKRGFFQSKAGVRSNLWTHMNHNLCLWKTSGAPVPQLGHAVWAHEWHHIVCYITWALKLDFLPASFFTPLSSSTQSSHLFVFECIVVWLHSSVSQPFLSAETELSISPHDDVV